MSALSTRTEGGEGVRQQLRHMVVVRHGERLDEVMPFGARQWKMHCKEKYSGREDHCSRLGDPILTEDGHAQARKVAETLHADREAAAAAGLTHWDDVRCIYASKLVRALQTAAVIAQKLELPIVASSGFAKTAAFVAKQADEFTHLSMEELAESCPPEVTLFDGDDAESPHFLPNSNWKLPFSHVLLKHQFAVVVCHRESIRWLADARLPLPYCCFGRFDFNHSFEENLVESATLRAVYDNQGNVIHTGEGRQRIPQPPPSDLTPLQAGHLGGSEH